MLIQILRNGGVSVALVLLPALLLMRRRRVRVMHVVCICLLTLYMSAVFTITGLTPMSGGVRLNVQLSDVNLVPFVGMAGIIRASVEHGESLFAITNLLGNVAMFVPLGLLLPLLWKRYRRLYKTVLFCLAVTLGIEIIQLFLSRGSDIDDVILNVLGGMVGYGLFLLLRRVAKRLTVRCALHKAQRRSAWRIFPYLCVLVPLLISFLLGAADRGGYFTPAAAQGNAPAQDALAEAAAPAETPQPAEGAPAGVNVGTLALTDVESMTIMSQRTIPPVTAEPTGEDRRALAALFAGRTLTDAISACDGDLVIRAGGATLVVHTACGAVYASLPDAAGATELTADDLEALGRILTRYDIAMETEP